MNTAEIALLIANGYKKDHWLFKERTTKTMNLESIQQEFDNWEPRAITKPESERENNAVMKCLTSIRALMKGKVDRETTIAITEGSIAWLKENAVGREAHRQIEIPVYTRYMQLLNEVSAS